MWNGKMKAVTFSFDDGVTQDEKMIEIFDKYGLKSTFNLNSGNFGKQDKLIRNGNEISFNRFTEKEAVKIYRNHEIAVHTVSHPRLTELSDENVLHEVLDDKAKLESVFNREIVGMAYPCGGINNDERVRNLIRKNTGIKYARTITSTYNFDLQSDLLEFNPSVYYIEDCLLDVCKKFIDKKADTPQLLYVWGHSFEIDAKYLSWDTFTEMCKMLSGRDDVFYGTNKEVLLDK